MLARDEAPSPGRAGFCLQTLHEQVLVLGVVMEDRERLYIGCLAQAYRLLPSRVTPADLGRKLLVRVRRIVDHQISALNQAEYVFVRPANDVLGIGDIDDRLPLELDTVGGGPVGVVQRHRLDLYSFAEREGIAGSKVLVLQFGAHHLHGHREGRLRHLIGQHLSYAHRVDQVPGHDGEASVFLKRRCEEGKAVDVVPIAYATSEFARS